VESAREALTEIERQVGLEREAEAHRLPASDVDPAERLAVIDARVDELRGLLAVLVPADPEPVVAALETLNGERAHELVPSPEAYALADDIDKIEQRLREQGEGGGADGERVAAARARLDAARAALVDAEQAARAPDLERDDVDALEQAHAEVLELQERADSRFGGARSRKRLDDARESERQILERLGFSTYADFMMGTSMVSVDPATEAALEAARAELVTAEDEWHDLQLALDVELERGALLDRRRELRERAQGILTGAPHDADLAAALRDLRVPAVDAVDAEVELRLALDEVGLPVADEDLDRETLIDLAQTWVREHERATERRKEVVEELDGLVAERDVLMSALSEGPASDREGREADREERLAEARRVLADAEGRLDSHFEADSMVADLEEQLALAATREHEATAVADGADERVEAALAAERVAIDELTRLEAEAAEAHAAETAATAELRRLEGTTDADGADGSDVELADLGALLAEAEADLADRTAILEALEQERAAVAADVERVRAEHARATGELAPSADEVEWYLLSRMAAQRAVSFAGSLPLVLDDALGALDDVEVTRLLDRVERMAATVQLIVLSDSPALLAWAATAGVARAAAVEPEPAGVPA
jgi:hypothetical protein